MKIIIEEKIPYIKGLLEPYGQVVYLPAKEFNPQSVKDADALFIRTSVKCNQELLQDSKVSFIASATIGLDHIDVPWCEAAGIRVANAPGCNSQAVAQWVFAALKSRFSLQELQQKVLGIIGVGHIGTIIDRWARGLGIKTLLNDPPRAEKEGKGFVDLKEIAESADIITFHTPLTRDGKYPTFHLCDSRFLASLKGKPVIMNASRGGVVDNYALNEALSHGLVSEAMLDVWENEPAINQELLEKVAVATPHIAGYSQAGKINATLMTLQAFSKHFHFSMPELAVPAPTPTPKTVAWDDINYDIMKDDAALRREPERFTALRDNYHLRP